MEIRLYNLVFPMLCWFAVSCVQAQGTVSARVEAPPGTQNTTKTNAVLWLDPISDNQQMGEWPAHPPYRLVQKSRAFSPHILVVPVGTEVAFPNADPFFHNVFSLFEGSRFDLGLYEAGSTRNVRFARKGVSYIFCNIHPEMGAVVLSLDTPLWILSSNSLLIHNVPRGTYDVSIWVEGQRQALLAQWKHRIVVGSEGAVDAGAFHAEAVKSAAHTDKFGHRYKQDSTPY